MGEGHYIYDAVSLQPGTAKLVPQGIKRILDLGGGCGGNGAAIKALVGADFICSADISEEAIRHAVAGVDATAICNAESAESLADVFNRHGPFDLVLCLDVLEHLIDPWRAVWRIHGLLDPFGYILASIPNVQNYRCILMAATGRWKYRDTGLFDRTHLRYFGKSSAIDLMTCSGLKLMGLGKTFGPAPRDALADKLSVGMLGRFVSMQNQILVRKENSDRQDPGFCGSVRATA